VNRLGVEEGHDATAERRTKKWDWGAAAIGSRKALLLAGSDDDPTVRRPLVPTMTDRVGVAPLAMPPLDAHLAAAVVANDALCGVLGFDLSAVHTAGALGVWTLDGPIRPVTDDITIILRHGPLLE